MQTRMQKYYEENTDTPLRQHKNEELYQNINNYEVEDYKLDSNATVLDNNAKEIDVEKIKKILDTKYNKEPKRRSIVVQEYDEEPNISMDETREYDINAILEKARSEKEVDYEQERLKKVRDTQFDILNSLDITGEEKKEEKEEPIKEEVEEDTLEVPDIKDKKTDDSELMDLINTITMRELDTKKEEQEELNPLDILTDLKGDENTVVVGASKEEESIGETSPIMSLEEATKARQDADIEAKNKALEEKIKEETKQEFTNTLAFTQSDFDDFNDLKKEVKSSRALIYVVIVVVSLILIAGIVIFLNKFLNIGLF